MEDPSDVDLPTVKRTFDNMKHCDSDIMNKNGDVSGSDSSAEDREGSPAGAWGSGDEDDRVARVIGELPIAEYEGSPRRYGVGPQLNVQTTRSPRPGFPQRVVTDSRDVTPPASSAAFDYLYEFSETRKVLEEFFRCPAGGQTADGTADFQAVSYVKFLDARTLVSASTDSQLKLWCVDSPRVVRSFTGHSNEKNFVGLATDGRYVACGSENNSLYVYYAGLARPLLSHRFDAPRGVLDRDRRDDEPSEFVSAVCWRRALQERHVLLAANSQGTIKVLELI